MLNTVQLYAALGTIVSFGMVFLLWWHAMFFARRWSESKTARLMTITFGLMALERCWRVIFNGMIAVGAMPYPLLEKIYPLGLFLTVILGVSLHLLAKHFDEIIEAQKKMMLRPGMKEWGE